MKLSVAICTWNRSGLLSQTLAQLATTKCNFDWELILVDNNSNDETRDVVRKYDDVLPLRYVFESQQGLSNARNRAIQLAVSEWLVFTDDDVIVESDWVCNYCEATNNVAKSVGFLGGEILPWFPEPPDPDLASAITMVRDGFCARSLPDNREITGSSSYFPYGANFAIRTEVARSLRFDPSLGVSGGNRVLGEEVVFMHELLKKGWTGLWVDRVKVRHYVDPKRLTRSSLRKSLFDAGRTRARRGHLLDGRFRIAGVPAWVFADVTKGLLWQSLPETLVRDRVKYFSRFRDLWYYSGYLRERFASAFRSNSTHR